MIQIMINGAQHDFPAPLSVYALLTHLALPAQKIAVERNLEIIPKSAYATTMLADRDRLEIVHFIGGG